MKTRFEEVVEKARHTRFNSTSQNRWQCPIFASMSLAVFCLLAVTSPLNAQTAHAGAPVPMGSGSTSLYGVAVDWSGNVFVADGGIDGVKGALGLSFRHMLTAWRTT